MTIAFNSERLINELITLINRVAKSLISIDQLINVPRQEKPFRHHHHLSLAMLEYVYWVFIRPRGVTGTEIKTPQTETVAGRWIIRMNETGR